MAKPTQRRKAHAFSPRVVRVLCAVEERMRIVDEYLQEFEARPVDSSVKPQPLFKVGTARIARGMAFTWVTWHLVAARYAVLGLGWL